MGFRLVVYTWTDEVDLVFEALGRVTKMPSGLQYGLMKADRFWDAVRKDPRFEKLLAELAPMD
jgi:hypothetical protein